MLDPLKKTLMASLGVVAFTKEKLERLIHDLVEKGELTRDQGKKLFDSLLRKGDAEGQNVVDRISREVQRVLGGGPFVTRDEFEALLERVQKLESRRRDPAVSSATEDGGSEVPY